MRIRSIGWIAGVALLAGCASAGPGDGTGMTPEGREWRLLEMNGEPARATPPTLRLDAAEKRVSGNTGCNSYFGSYELSGDSLSFGALASTRRACLDPAANTQEGAYLGALNRTRTWRLDGGALVLSGEEGELARFSPQ